MTTSQSASGRRRNKAASSSVGSAISTASGSLISSTKAYASGRQLHAPTLRRVRSANLQAFSIGARGPCSHRDVAIGLHILQELVHRIDGDRGLDPRRLAHGKLEVNSVHQSFMQLSPRPKAHVLICAPRPHGHIGIGGSQCVRERMPARAKPLTIDLARICGAVWECARSHEFARVHVPSDAPCRGAPRGLELTTRDTTALARQHSHSRAHPRTDPLLGRVRCSAPRTSRDDVTERYLQREAGPRTRPRLARVLTWDEDAMFSQNRYAAPTETQLSRSCPQMV